MKGVEQDEGQRVVTIVLGAAEFPRSPALNAPELTKAFARSKDGVKEYLAGISETVLDLFDDPRTPSELGLQVHRFLTEHRNATDVIVFYVGHGGFLHDQTYYLAIACTDTATKSFTALKVTDLADTLRTHPGRVYLILDCCFSGAAVKTFFQGSEAELVASQTRKLPRGVAVLAASSQDEAALTPKESAYTMFSEAILSAWSTGSASAGERLSLKQLGDLVANRVESKYDAGAVRPQVQSPIQRDGDPADYPLFVNAGWTGTERSASAKEFIEKAKLSHFMECRVYLRSATSSAMSSISELRAAVNRAAGDAGLGSELNWAKNVAKTVTATTLDSRLFVRLASGGAMEVVCTVSDDGASVTFDALRATVTGLIRFVTALQHQFGTGSIGVELLLQGAMTLELQDAERRYKSDERSIVSTAKMSRTDVIDRRQEIVRAFLEEVFALYNVPTPTLVPPVKPHVRSVVAAPNAVVTDDAQRAAPKPSPVPSAPRLEAARPPPTPSPREPEGRAPRMAMTSVDIAYVVLAVIASCGTLVLAIGFISAIASFISSRSDNDAAVEVVDAAAPIPKMILPPEDTGTDASVAYDSGRTDAPAEATPDVSVVARGMLKLSLCPRMGASSFQGFDVHVNGMNANEWVEDNGVIRMSLMAGSYRIVAKANGRVTTSESVQVTAGAEKGYTICLKCALGPSDSYDLCP